MGNDGPAHAGEHGGTCIEGTCGAAVERDQLRLEVEELRCRIALGLASLAPSHREERTASR